MSVSSSVSLERRNLFDQFALGCISYLEHCEECRTVTFQGNDAAASHELLIWEKRNAPLRLPEDLRRFYSMMNGFSLNWAVEIDEKLVTIGEMRLNRLEHIIRNPCEATISTPSLPYMEMSSLPDVSKCSMFTLDPGCEFGDIVLLYRSSTSESSSSSSGGSTINGSESGNVPQPEIWLLDVSGQLTYICSSFTQYMRLMTVHLGILGWQGVFTADGLSETTQHWMNVFCKERLVGDRHFRAEIQRSRYV